MTTLVPSTALVPYDSHGRLGPAFSLLYLHEDLSQKGLDKVTRLMKANFKKVCPSMKPEGRKEFCATVAAGSVKDLTQTRFFQSMQSRDVLPNHQEFVQTIIPIVYKVASQELPEAPAEEQNEAIKEWLARYMECFMTAESIASSCKVSQQPNSDAINDERTKVGRELVSAAEKGQLPLSVFEAILSGSKSAVNAAIQSENPKQALEIIKDYLRLFSMGEDPAQLAEDVTSKLDIYFRPKFYSPSHAASSSTN